MEKPNTRIISNLIWKSQLKKQTAALWIMLWWVFHFVNNGFKFQNISESDNCWFWFFQNLKHPISFNERTGGFLGTWYFTFQKYWVYQILRIWFILGRTAIMNLRTCTPILGGCLVEFLMPTQHSTIPPSLWVWKPILLSWRNCILSCHPSVWLWNLNNFTILKPIYLHPQSISWGCAIELGKSQHQTTSPYTSAGQVGSSYAKTLGNVDKHRWKSC